MRVRAGGVVLAESSRPRLVSETGLPNRFYLLREDLREARLAVAAKRTVCPYKGEATYYSVEAGGRVFEEAAWSYEAPLEDAAKIRGYVCFLGAGIDVEADAAAD